MMVFFLIVHATHIYSTLNLISSKHYSVFTVMFLWTKQNPKSLAVKCHKWFCHALKVQDSGSTTVHLHYIFSWNSVNCPKGISYNRAAHTHTQELVHHCTTPGLYLFGPQHFKPLAVTHAQPHTVSQSLYGHVKLPNTRQSHFLLFSFPPFCFVLLLLFVFHS